MSTLKAFKRGNRIYDPVWRLLAVLGDMSGRLPRIVHKPLLMSLGVLRREGILGFNKDAVYYLTTNPRRPKDI